MVNRYNMKKQQEICLNIAINWTGSQSKMEKKRHRFEIPQLVCLAEWP